MVDNLTNHNISVKAQA